MAKEFSYPVENVPPELVELLRQDTRLTQTLTDMKATGVGLYQLSKGWTHPRSGRVYTLAYELVIFGRPGREHYLAACKDGMFYVMDDGEWVRKVEIEEALGNRVA